MIAKVLEAVRALPAEDAAALVASNRHHLQEGIDALWYQCKCDVELEVSPGKFEKLECTSFSKALKWMARDLLWFREALIELFQSKPCTESNPYSLVIYGDELVPGNVLAQDQSRKIFGCQAHIKDFGPKFARSDAYDIRKLLRFPAAYLTSFECI